MPQQQPDLVDPDFQSKSEVIVRWIKHDKCISVYTRGDQKVLRADTWISKASPDFIFSWSLIRSDLSSQTVFSVAALYRRACYVRVYLWLCNVSWMSSTASEHWSFNFVHFPKLELKSQGGKPGTRGRRWARPVFSAVAVGIGSDLRGCPTQSFTDNHLCCSYALSPAAFSKYVEQPVIWAT